MTANVVRTVLLDILLPIAAYFGLVSCGLTPAWALAASAGIAVVALGARWFRSRELSTLGLLVLVSVASLMWGARDVSAGRCEPFHARCRRQTRCRILVALFVGQVESGTRGSAR